VGGALLGAGVLLLVGATALLLALALGIAGRGLLALAVYVLGFAEIVALALFLSLFDAFSRSVAVAAVALVFVGALALAWWRRTFPPAAIWRVQLAAVPGPVLFLSVVVALAAAYVLALIVGTAPNGWDPLNYHLARAAFWVQSHHIGYVRDAYDQRLNFNPPNAEIGDAFLLDVTRAERSAGLPQFFAVLFCGLGVYAFARRLGRDRPSAAFGALLFLLAPIVLLQASGAKNDVVVASFLMVAAVFTVGRTNGELVLASLATALAVGTKFTAAYGLVVLAALVFVATSSQRLLRLGAIATGALAGSYWYVVNAHETGMLLGDQSGTGTLTAPFQPKPNLLTLYGDALDTVDLSGARGKDILVFAVVALVLAAAMAFRHRRKEAAVAAILVATPFVLLPLAKVGRSGFVHLYNGLGKPPGYLAIGDDITSSATVASDTASWFGPAGFLLVTGFAVLILQRRGRRSSRLVALTPLVWLAMVALTLTYHPWQGRFFVFPLALAAVLWGKVLSRSATAWGISVLAATTAFLALVHYAEKPSGLRLFEPTNGPSVWQMTRAQVQSQHDPPLERVLQFFDESVPAHTSIALALGPNEFAFPFFGPQLTRRVVLVPDGSTARDLGAAWLYADTQRAAGIDKTCWEPRLASDRGVVFQRAIACDASG
jgi:hypothetical protein